MNKEVLSQWERLLCSYFTDPAMSKEMRAGVLLLLSDECFEREKLVALEKYFNQMVGYDPAPGEDVLASLQKTKAKLGF